MDTILWTLVLCGAAVAAVNASCGKTEYNCQTRHGGHCLALRWLCDGDNDCIDHSDERQCGSRRACPDGFFACDSGRCIPSQWECDGMNDCRDHGSDEQHCGRVTTPSPASAQTCPPRHFACDSGHSICIPITWLCDGASDCPSGSDERNCPTATATVAPTAQHHCTADKFACRSHRRSSGCIPLRWVCDGDLGDCLDGSDERHCGSPRTCPEGHFSCDSGQCIPNNWVCDGANDCHNSDLDERHCLTTATTPSPLRTFSVPQAACSEEQFSCASRRWRGGCIPLVAVCDARAGDCDDGSDETHCGSARACPPRWVACASGRCVPPTMACDGRSQCPDSADQRQCGGNPAVDATVSETLGRSEGDAATQGGTLRLELPRGFDQDSHFALSLAPMLRARSPRDKLDAKMAVLRLFRDLARN